MPRPERASRDPPRATDREAPCWDRQPCAGGVVSPDAGTFYSGSRIWRGRPGGEDDSRFGIQQGAKKGPACTFASPGGFPSGHTAAVEVGPVFPQPTKRAPRSQGNQAENPCLGFLLEHAHALAQAPAHVDHMAPLFAGVLFLRQNQAGRGATPSLGGVSSVTPKGIRRMGPSWLWGGPQPPPPGLRDSRSRSFLGVLRHARASLPTSAANRSKLTTPLDRRCRGGNDQNLGRGDTDALHKFALVIDGQRTVITGSFKTGVRKRRPQQRRNKRLLVRSQVGRSHPAMFWLAPTSPG